MRDVLIGIDIGTTAVKAVMSGPDGERLAAFAAPHPMHRETPGAAEQDPADWVASVEAALLRFAAHPRAGEVGAIGVTSQVNTHVFCGADLAALRPAVTWQDTRAAAEAARLDARLGPEAKIAALGAPIPIDASHALSRMAWVARNEPGVWAATRQVLLPKDYVIARLTGEAVADPLSAVGLAGADLRYASAVVDPSPGRRGACRRSAIPSTSRERSAPACPSRACPSPPERWTPGPRCSGSASRRRGKRCTSRARAR
jgi:xylulokinase